LSLILSVYSQFHFGHDVVCLLLVSLCPWYCMSFNWQKTDNIMAKGKRTKTDNNMAEGKLTKDRQYHGQMEADKRQTISWPWYCMSFVSFPLAMILSVFFQLPFGHDIVCLLSASIWPWYCPHHGQREADKRQTISWPKENWQKTNNIMAKGKLTKDRQYHGPKKTDKRQKISWPKGN
jgi:hypothetical protein